jgi:hypothetical protein
MYHTTGILVALLAGLVLGAHCMGDKKKESSETASTDMATTPKNIDNALVVIQNSGCRFWLLTPTAHGWLLCSRWAPDAYLFLPAKMAGVPHYKEELRRAFGKEKPAAEPSKSRLFLHFLQPSLNLSPSVASYFYRRLFLSFTPGRY